MTSNICAASPPVRLLSAALHGCSHASRDRPQNFKQAERFHGTRVPMRMAPLRPNRAREAHKAQPSLFTRTNSVRRHTRGRSLAGARSLTELAHARRSSLTHPCALVACEVDAKVINNKKAMCPAACTNGLGFFNAGDGPIEGPRWLQSQEIAPIGIDRLTPWLAN